MAIKVNKDLAGVGQWIERGLQTDGLLVRFPVGAYAWVAGQVPSGCLLYTSDAADEPNVV